MSLDMDGSIISKFVDVSWIQNVKQYIGCGTGRNFSAAKFMHMETEAD